jgi:hypothetical protein
VGVKITISSQGEKLDSAVDPRFGRAAQFILYDTVARGRDLITTAEKYKNKVIIKVNRCPLDFDIPEMCLAHTTMEKTVVEELNPNLIYRIGMSIPAGDSCCEHILEIKMVDYRNSASWA